MTTKTKAGIAGLAAAALFASTAMVAFAAPSQQACFGQGRSAGVHAIGGKTWGDIASDRAGDNAAMNAAYRDACQGA